MLYSMKKILFVLIFPGARMATSQCEGAQQLLPQAIAALVENALYQADLVGRFLNAVRHQLPASKQKEPIALPADFLLELGAALRLAMWERQGFRPYLPDFPSAETAIVELVQRCWPDQTGPSTGESILRRVLETWFGHFAWSGLEELGVDVLLDTPGSAALFDDLAGFLWAHRVQNNEGQPAGP